MCERTVLFPETEPERASRSESKLIADFTPPRDAEVITPVSAEVSIRIPSTKRSSRSMRSRMMIGSPISWFTIPAEVPAT